MNQLHSYGFAVKLRWCHPAYGQCVPSLCLHYHSLDTLLNYQMVSLVLNFPFFVTLLGSCIFCS